MPTKPTFKERKLLRSVRIHGEAGWEELYAHFDPMIREITAWRDHRFSKEVQEDVCQRIRVELQKAIPRFKGGSTLAYYIKKISMYQCVNEIRRQNRLGKTITYLVQIDLDGEWSETELADPSAQDARQALLKLERAETVREAVQELNPTCRDSITMFYFDEMPYAEIAERLGITQNTVGSRIAKCRDKLQRELRRLPLFQGDRT